MLTITKLVQNMECSFCQKAKDGALVKFEDESGGESPLCWPCIKKMANRKMRMAEHKTAPPSQTATPLAQVLKNAGNAVPAATK